MSAADNPTAHGPAGSPTYSQDGGHDGHGHHDHPEWVAHHFETAEQQFDSGKLGMWLFLTQEVLFFSGLFCAYIIYRALHPEVFVWAHQFLDKSLGAFNTLVLLFSSFTMAWAVRNAQLAQHKLLYINLTITLACAMLFLGVKAVEYSHKFDEGLFWAGAYQPHETVITGEEAAGMTSTRDLPSADTGYTGLTPNPRAVDSVAKSPEGDDNTHSDDHHADGDHPSSDVHHGGHHGPKGLILDIAKSMVMPAAATREDFQNEYGVLSSLAGALSAVHTGVSSVLGWSEYLTLLAWPGIFCLIGSVVVLVLGLVNRGGEGNWPIVAPFGLGLTIMSVFFFVGIGFGFVVPEVTRAIFGDGRQVEELTAFVADRAERQIPNLAGSDLPGGMISRGGLLGSPNPNQKGMNDPSVAMPPAEVATNVPAISPTDRLTSAEPNGVGLFFSIYYCMTGVHAIHIIAGIIVICWVMWKGLKRQFHSEYFGPVDNVGLYWHLVDLVWIYLFPLLYLIH